MFRILIVRTVKARPQQSFPFERKKSPNIPCFCKASICFLGNLKSSAVSNRKPWVWFHFSFGVGQRQTSQGLHASGLPSPALGLFRDSLNDFTFGHGEILSTLLSLNIIFHPSRVLHTDMTGVCMVSGAGSEDSPEWTEEPRFSHPHRRSGYRLLYFTSHHPLHIWETIIQRLRGASESMNPCILQISV